MIKTVKSKERKKDRTGKDEQKKSLQLRRIINDLYFEKHIPKKMIARSLKVSKGYVARWTSSPEQDCSTDDRGWPRDKARAWGDETKQRVMALQKMIESDPQQFYTGATAIAQEWRRHYPSDPVPSLRTIGRIQAALGLSNKRQKGRTKGAARYLCYPEHTIYHRFQGRLLEADFIGRKFIEGSGDPLHFIGFSFKQEPRIRYFRRVEGETGSAIIRECEAFFSRFEKPDYLKVDNCAATIGSASCKRTISQVVRFLLCNQVVPIFAVPRKPFSQASIEGNNSVFARKFWTKRKFTSLSDVDMQLDWFNSSSETYTGYIRPTKTKRAPKKKDFVPRVYFIRQVAEDTNKGFISVLNEKISLPASYINYFVLAEWNLVEQCLVVYFEKDLKPTPIKRLNFLVNPNAKFAFDQGGSLSFD
jgi:hypothetical protein